MNIALKALGLSLFGALLLPACCAGAETLSDADIRALYASVDAATTDADKTHKIMEERFDSQLVLTVATTRLIGDNPPQTASDTMTKAQIIRSDTETRSIAQIGSHSNEVSGITYSDDKKWAYVTNTTTITGRMNIPVAPGKTLPADYTDQLSCVDTLGLEGATLKLMKSDCKELTKIKKPAV